MDTTSPYSTPEGDLIVSGEEEFGEIRFFSPSCRIGRLRYLSHSMLFTLLGYAALIPGILFLTQGMSGLGASLMVVGYIAMIVLFVILILQRLHDLDKTGWLALLMIVPLLNIALALFLIFGRGSDGENRFGAPPPPNKLWNKIVALIFPALFIVGILAAIALPAYQQYVERASGM